MQFLVHRAVSCMAVAIVHLLPITSAHLFMMSPKPIEGSAPKNPLRSDGSDFPCHGVSLNIAPGQSMEAGSTLKLQFDLGAHGENTAVHGGGSCQLAVTYETSMDEVRDPSNWHVIYSIEGGCPSNSAGNLLNSTYCASPGQAECVHTWDVPLPKGLRSGHAVMAWTWFNTIGDREMYQNCAGIEITGGTGDDMGSFPSMYVANIGRDPICTAAPEQTNLAFPDPGRYRTTMSATNGKNWPYATATCSFQDFSRAPIHTSPSIPYTVAMSPNISSATSSPFRRDGFPHSEVLSRLATAAIVTRPLNSAVGEQSPSIPEDSPGPTTTIWHNVVETKDNEVRSSSPPKSPGDSFDRTDLDAGVASELHISEIAGAASTSSLCLTRSFEASD